MWQIWLLAADAAGKSPQQIHEAQMDIIWWGTVLGAIVIIGGGLLMVFRNRILRQEEPEAAPGIDLNDLRALRDSGALTDQEYETARAKISARIKQQAGIVAGDLTLPQIREMLDRGELSAAQYEVERKKIMERLKGRPTA
jgi:hypothetical protein